MHPDPVPALRALRHAAAPLLPLEALAPDDYKLGHALFEARSDQRAAVISWLTRFVATRTDRPNRVLSIGCGDGTVDVAVAATLAAEGQPVRYVGVEPHAPSAEEFRRRMAGLRGVRAETCVLPFGRFEAPAERFDVITAVHSLYYVPDLVDALRRARELLAPGGVLVVMHAPLGALNELVGVLAPGPVQEFSAAVAEALEHASIPVTRTRIDACVDLTPEADRPVARPSGPADARRALDFAVQAVLPEVLHALVLDALRPSAEPGRALRLPHPLDVFVIEAAPADLSPTVAG